MTDGKRDAVGGRALPGIAGMVAVAVALGLTELFAGIATTVPAAISAVGSLVVDATPSLVESVAIAVFGTADKGALAVGTVVIALLVGLVLGRFARRRRWVGPVGFGLFGVLGVAAQLRAPGAATLPVVLTTGAAAATGATTLDFFLRGDRGAVEADHERRRVVGALAAVGGLALVAVLFGRRSTIRRSQEVADPPALPEPVVRAVTPRPRHRFTVPGLTPLVLGVPDFYRVDTALAVPTVDPRSWRLRVTGMVDDELELTLEDLLSMAQEEHWVTLSCVSNPVGDDLVGNARWQGVPLDGLLAAAGVHPGADQVVGRSVDGWTCGFPTELARDGRAALVALGMNGAPLPRRHGYPARLVVPGLYGYVSATKWLAEIELTTWDAFDAYWVPRGWAKFAPIKTQSRIDRPRRGETVPVGTLLAAGLAWAPHRGISAVEVRLDDGRWQPAELTAPLSADAWRQWRIVVDVAPGEHLLAVRATDGSGDTQTGRRHGPRPDGATGWHTVPFRAA